jgi:hypothetical protein
MKHLDITEFLCDECGEAFAMQKLLRKHVVTMHGSEELRYRETTNHGEAVFTGSSSGISFFRISDPVCPLSNPRK